jgi:hypothetical protein
MPLPMGEATVCYYLIKPSWTGLATKMTYAGGTT